LINYEYQSYRTNIIKDRARKAQDRRKIKKGAHPQVGGEAETQSELDNRDSGQRRNEQKEI
jgi:hypothetical protein